MKIINLIRWGKTKNFLRISLIIVTILIICPNLKAQQQQIQLTGDNITLRTAFKQIEKQTQFSIDYDAKMIDVSRTISFVLKPGIVDDILNQVLRNTGYTYQIRGTHILIIKESVFEKDRKITGIITDSQGDPIIGANVVVKGSITGTVTDLDGNFELQASPGAALIISYVGYISKEISTKGQEVLNVHLSEDMTALEEIVVIGYGTSKRKDITGAVASVTADKLKETPAVSLNQALQGKTAGVQVTLGDNTPGGGVGVLIRGMGSITQSNDPIYVVDGIIMQGTLNNINVNDIASIDVLKDASAAAIYGSRAANGVVIVTTKRGKEGKGTVSLSLRTSVQSADNLPKMLSAQELAQIRIEGNVNSNLDALYLANSAMGVNEYGALFNDLKSQYTRELPLSMFSEAERQTLREGQSYDWYDEIARTGLIQDYTVAFSGANENSNYYISANYYNHRGLIIGSDHRRINFRINLEQKVKNWLKIGVNSNYTDGKTAVIGESVSTGLGANPMYPFFIDGKRPLSVPFYTSEGQSNPILSKEINNDATSRRYSVNAYLIIDFTKELFLKSNVVADVTNNFSGYFAPSNIKEGETKQGIAQIRNESWSDFMQENTLNYAKTFNKRHQLNALVGNTIQMNTYRTNTQYATSFATNVLSYNNIGSASNFAPAFQSSGKTEWQIASFIGRLNYTFDDKYIFTATGRFDGNSKYGVNNKWGFFPSFATAWRISSEKFMRELSFLNDMKIRLSWGEMGNSNIEPYASFTKLSPGITVGPDGKPVNTIQNMDQLMGNPTLRWERQQQMNIGIDLVALNNRMRFSLDMYKKKSKDLVLRTPMPITTGYSLIYSNVGELQNKGLEISLGGRILDGPVKWDIDLNWSANHNKLTSLYGGLTERMNDPNSPTAAGWWVGKPLGTIYTYRYEGIWQWNDDRVLMDKMKDGMIGGDTYYPGENKIADLDGDNTITTADREIVGYTDPKWYGGLSSGISYKNFSLDVNFNYVFGNKIFNRSYHEYTLGAGYGFQNLTEDALDRWNVDNQQATVPRAHANNLDRMIISSRLMQDGSYLRLKTATLNYRFSEKFLKNLYLNNLNIYVSGENLWTWTHYKGANPESPGPWSESYPNAQAISFGLNVNF